MAECIQFIPSKLTFDGTMLPNESYVQMKTKGNVPFSDLKRVCDIIVPKSNWLYDYDPARKHSSFCYCRNNEKIPPSIAGKSTPSVLELFAGAGGMFFGFRNAGLETEWVVECNESAVAT
jgi:hypothetical protein